LDQSVQWVTSVTIAQRGGQVELSLVLRISATQFQIRPFAFEIGTPKLLVDVLGNYECAIDGSSIPRAVHRLTAPQVVAFVGDLLLAPSRNLPIVLVSPDAWTGRSLVNADDMAARLLGLAQVAVLDDKWAAFKLTDLVGRDHTCFDGAVRLYCKR
jgi:hypothetical protein